MEEKMLNTILLEFEKLNKRLDATNNKLSLVDARFNTLEEIILSIQNDIVSLQDSMQYVQNRITTLEKSIKNIQDKLINFESTIQIIQDKFSNFEKAIEDIQNRMSKFENRQNSLEKITLRMEYTFNDKISALFDAHSYYSDQYQKLEHRIRQNEIKITNLSISNC